MRPLGAGNGVGALDIETAAPELGAAIDDGHEDKRVALRCDRGVEAVVTGAELDAGRRVERQADGGRERRRRLAVPLHERPREQRGQDEEDGSGRPPDQNLRLQVDGQRSTTIFFSV